MIEHPNNAAEEKVWPHCYIPVFLCMIILTWVPGASVAEASADKVPYAIVDTAQVRCYSNNAEIEFPQAGTAFFGQDAQYTGNDPSYTDNGDGTVTDNVTGLIWQQDPGAKMSYDEAVAGADTFNLAGYDDWRLPTTKELYSLILFSGIDPSNYEGSDTSGLAPFIDTDYFVFEYGDTNAGERIIDAQFLSSNEYVRETMEGRTVFGVNFADGRIKGCGTGPMPGRTEDKQFFILYVRGNTDYETNNFIDNGDGAITDNATGLMWAQDDSGEGLNWEEALASVEQKNAENYLDYNDWRLPNVKELQSIVDYTRSPDTSSSAAIDPLFNATSITNEAGQADYPCYWSSTTHANWTDTPGAAGAYVAFGRAMGYMNGRWIDVHGAGAQRSDPKTGDPADYPTGRGPQGDAIRIYNYVRLVRDIEDTYIIVDTGQVACYDNEAEISCPGPSAAFYGQDAQYNSNQPSYTTSGDGLTVLDNVTGLTWTQGADWSGDGIVNASDKFTYTDAQTYVDTLNAQDYGGYSDWRAPTIKQLYSLIDYRGTDPDPMAGSTSGLVPFIDDNTFQFAYGDTSAGERIIDSQWATSTLYVGTVFDGIQAMFGVNFADGRIKGYGLTTPNPLEGEKTFYLRPVRGNTAYGMNSFADNGNGTITDNATELMWSQDDSSAGMNWGDALAWVQQKNAENYLGHDNWRLPNAKELQSLLDYTRSPDTTDSAAIDPVFSATEITNEAGEPDYPFYWSGTSFLRFDGSATRAVYVAFGRGLGSMDGANVIDVHGAGCQRSDPKDGDPDNYPSWGFGPQGDMQRVFNYVRLVRNI